MPGAFVRYHPSMSKVDFSFPQDTKDSRVL
jgi:hypothetical protein